MSLDPRSWHEQSACAGADTELFFPPRIKEKYEEIASQARAYCFGQGAKPACPVRKKCLEWAIVSDELHGIWGGLSHRERNALVRKATRQGKSVHEFIKEL